MFYHHGKDQNFDNLLKFANESYEKGIIGILLTAPFLWDKLYSAQKQMIEPKVKVMWCSDNNNLDRWGGFNAYGNCFLWQSDTTTVYLIDGLSPNYFIPAENAENETHNDSPITTMTISIICPHCGKKIF
jgi:hypothetical protein